MNYTQKKAILFGIDARITLTVIAVISAIGYFFAKDTVKNTQKESFIQQIITLRTAAKQNIADNGWDFSIGSTNLNDNLFGIADENPNNLTLGRNKYAYVTESNYASATNEIAIMSPKGNIIVNAKNLFSSLSNNGTNSSITDCANTSASCFYWFKMTNVPKDFYEIIEEHFDGDSTLANATTTGIVVAPNQTLNSFTGTVFIKIGER